MHVIYLLFTLVSAHLSFFKTDWTDASGIFYKARSERSDSVNYGVMKVNCGGI